MRVLALVTIGVPLSLLVSLGLLTILDQNDTWQMPAETDITLAVIVFLSGIWVLFKLNKKERVGTKADPFRPDPMMKWRRVH